MNASERAGWWRIGLGLLCFGAGLTAVLSVAAQELESPADRTVQKNEEQLSPPRPERSKYKKSELDKKIEAEVEASLPQRPPSILPKEMNAIDLGCVLRLAGADNPDILLARQRVARAQALRFYAMTFVLPNLNAGLNYDDHNGPLQQSSGNILTVNRQALYVGSGAGAVAAGTVGVPGVQYILNFSDGIFNMLAIKYNLRARQAENIAVRNQIFLQVTRAYMRLVRAESWRAIAIKNQEEAYAIAHLTALQAARGIGLSRKADADRAASELARRNYEILDAERAILEASARLAALLNIPPSVQMHALDGWVVPTEIVPNALPLQELLFIATQQRPELAARSNEIREAVMRMRNNIFLPLSPTVLAGYSSGTFGGGSNLVAYPNGFQGFKEPYFGTFGPRQDIDVIMFWTAQNLGVGNLGKFFVSRAEKRIADLEFVRELNRVRDDVAVAYARIHASYGQIDIARRGVEAAYESYRNDYTMTLQRGNVRPIELLNSFRLLAAGRMDWLDAVVNYDTAQFALYVALGQPPPDKFAHEIPNNENMPTAPAPAPPLPACVAQGGCLGANVADPGAPVTEAATPAQSQAAEQRANQSEPRP